MERRGARPKLRGEYLNFLRFTVTQSAAATYTQTELDTNLSAERGVMMDIHGVDFLINPQQLSEAAANSAETNTIQVVRESKTALVNPNDSDLIALQRYSWSRSAAIGTDAGPMWWFNRDLESLVFPLPIPYVKPSIFVGVNSTYSSAITVYGRIAYTLRDISREEFLELLVSLQ